jgi:hypothetical protein
METALKQLTELESQGVKGSFITEDGIFRYNKNMPTFEESAERKKDGLFIIQRMGDVLLSVRISGTYTHAKMYQYDFFDRQLVYWEGQTEEPIAPFKDGIFLLHVGKNIYIEIENGENIKIQCKYAVLDNQSRRESIKSYHEGYHGVKLEHVDSTLYQACHINDIGHSPNVLAPVTDNTMRDYNTIVQWNRNLPRIE